MRNCSISITTTVDGNALETVKKGECVLGLTTARLCYFEEQAKVCITLENDELRIVREGDYTQDLYFVRGKTCEGKLGIGGADGVIYTNTKKLGYSLTETSFLLSLHYDLIVGGEPQSMQIRLFAKFTD